jgi:exodeoxyribonuclease III
MRIASWNIKRGGAGREEPIAEAIAHHAPDVAVLVEYVPDRSAALVERLAARGFAWIHAAEPTDAPARALIASTVELEPVAPSAPDLDLCNRWAEVSIPSHDLRLAGVYVPVTGNRPGRKRRMWQAVQAAADRRRTEAYMVVGDWNTGDFPLDKSRPGRPFKFTREHRELLASGYTEAWRLFHPETAEFSWYRHDGTGFRIDHAFVSPSLLPRLRDCWYSHKERVAGASDHSILIVDLGADLTGPRPEPGARPPSFF